MEWTEQKRRCVFLLEEGQRPLSRRWLSNGKESKWGREREREIVIQLNSLIVRLQKVFEAAVYQRNDQNEKLVHLTKSLTLTFFFFFDEKVANINVY